MPPTARPPTADALLAHGRGIAGASIAPMCDAFRARWKGDILSTSHDALDGVRTDEDGRFELEDVPRSLVYLRIDGEGILPLEYGFDRIESLEIVVHRRAHVQVELSDPASADEFALLDEKGSELELSMFSGNGRREGMRQPIRAGLSDVVAGIGWRALGRAVQGRTRGGTARRDARGGRDEDRALLERMDGRTIPSDRQWASR